MVKKSLLAKLTPGERKKIKIERLIHRGVLSLFGAIVLPVCIGWFTQEKIVPRYYDDKDNWIRMMRHTIAFNASFFNTNRMIQQYILNAYFN